MKQKMESAMGNYNNEWWDYANYDNKEFVVKEPENVSSVTFSKAQFQGTRANSWENKKKHKKDW